MIFASAAALVVAGFCGLQWSSPATVRDAHAEPAVEAELSLERAAAETPDPLVPSMTLHGVDGAATALAIRDYKTALAVLEGVAAPPKGTVSWFTIGALKGRVLRLIGEPKRALGALGPLWQHKRLSHGFPPEVIALELARAHIDWAGTGELKRGDADEERRRALRVLERAKRFSPNRHEAEIEVLIAQTLLGIEGSTKYAQKTAARKAIKVANNIIAEYPNHPDVGTVKLAVARAYARAGQVPNAAHALRKLAIERAGEPEADQAWRELELLADRDRRVRVRPLSPLERLEQANNARSLRRVEVSRKILDELASDGSLPQYVREQAMRSRAFTAYKQRDYDQCVEDLKAVSTARDYADVRESLLRCWERAQIYDPAIDLVLKEAENKNARIRANTAWDALHLALRGGRYERALELLDEYERLVKYRRAQRAWLRAWLNYRLGKNDEAIVAFEEAERYSGQRTEARYFRAKLLVARDNAEEREEGGRLLRSIVQAQPLDYYGLMARQRLLDAGLQAPDPGELAPMPLETQTPTRLDTQALLDRLDEEFGGAWPPVRRARQLYAAGYIEEARREVRVAVEAFVTGGKSAGGVRHEAFEVGSGWRPTWKATQVAPTKAGRRTLRDRFAAEKLRVGLRQLSKALDEPYRMARLTDASEAGFKERWHPRAYRAVLEREARVRDIDPVHLWSLMYTESRFRRFVVSPVGARGALQIMPWTGRQLVERLGELEGGRFDSDRLFDIDYNAHLAAYYIAELLAKFHHQAPLAYASYNGGPSNVARWLEDKAKGGAPLDLDTFIEEIPFSETQRYVRRVMEVSAAYELMYRGKLPQWSNKLDPKFEDNIDF